MISMKPKKPSKKYTCTHTLKYAAGMYSKETGQLYSKKDAIHSIDVNRKPFTTHIFYPDQQFLNFIKFNGYDKRCITCHKRTNRIFCLLYVSQEAAHSTPWEDGAKYFVCSLECKAMFLFELGLA